MSSLNRLNATSDKFLLQEIANNTKDQGGIALRTPSATPSSMAGVGIFGGIDGGNTFKALKVSSDGTLAVDLAIDETTLATEAKQDDMILQLTDIESEIQANGVSLTSIDTELTAQGSTLTSIDTELTSQGSTLNNIDVELTEQGISLDNIDTKLTVGDDDEITIGLQVVAYGRKDASPSGLRALKTDFEGQVFVKNQVITSGNDTTLTNSQQVLTYGKAQTSGDLKAILTSETGNIINSPQHAPIITTDGTTTEQRVMIHGNYQGNLRTLACNSSGELITTSPSRVLTPYTSFINNITLQDWDQSTQTITMGDYKNITLVGSCNESDAELGLAFYDGVSAWRTDGIRFEITFDDTHQIRQFAYTLRDVGTPTLKLANLKNNDITGLTVSYYRF